MTTTDLALASPSTGALALRADQHHWTDQQRAALAQLGVDKANPGDLAVFMHVSQRTGLDPFSKQIYMIERGGKWTIQTGIDGFRVIAERRPEYAGQTEPQWCGEDGVWHDVWLDPKRPPHAARVGALRHDRAQPMWGICLFAEFTAGNSMWRTKGAHQIAKCAEALALRKAFPNDFAGLLIPEETDRDDRPRTSSSASTAPAAAPTVIELTGGTPAAEPAGERMTQPQQRKVFALLREAEVDDRLAYAAEVLGRPIESYGQLTGADADALIGALEARAQQPAGPAAAEQAVPAGDDR